jgi:3-methyladenine DNA glycosylase AlkD
VLRVPHQLQRPLRRRGRSVPRRRRWRLSVPSSAAVLRGFDAAFRKAGTRGRAAGTKAYLKSDLEFYGVTSPDLYRIIDDFDRRHPGLTRTQVLALVRALWATTNHEMRSAGIKLLEQHEEQLGGRDLPLLERLLRASRSWAYVDWLCTRVVAPIVEREPAQRRVLARWARDRDFWIRRSALLSLLPALRRGEGDFALFERLAVPMLGESEFFIRKAIGWVLRDVSHRRPGLTAAFVRRHAGALSGVTWREAAKYIPAADRAAVEAIRT